MPPREHLILLTGPKLSAEDQRLADFAEAMGISATRVSVQDWNQRLGDFQPRTYCLAVSAGTLAVMNPASDAGRWIESSAALLVFGCTGSTEQLQAISRLVAGAVCGIGPAGGQTIRFAFPREAAPFSRQLAGLDFSETFAEPVPSFELHNPSSGAEVIMSANDHPVFVSVARGSCPIFLLSATLPDLEERLDPDRELQEHYHRLIPALIFLRHCFGKRCWHGPQNTARLIVDDPLLTERYGFLDQSVLAESMQRNKYGTSLAFIPWNSWRTSRRNASRLLAENSNLAICVHGCDHTNKEFEVQDGVLLEKKAGLALRRMESQCKRTGTEFERVMVFPQGLFSTAAIAALRAQNYLAVVNTSCFPSTEAADLKVADCLQPAVTRYSGFPIFQRRYPTRLFDFAFDLFLGRPVLVVEHHEYFRDGCGTLEKLVAELYKLEPALSWPTLTDQLTRSCRKRNLADGSVEIQFFTKSFQFSNREPDPRRFLLSKPEPDAALIQDVLVDGKSAPFSFDKESLKLEVTADSGEVRNIEVVDRDRPRQRVGGFGVIHNSAVLLRRGLSEFRDNTLARHGGLLRVAKQVARGLRVTGDA